MFTRAFLQCSLGVRFGFILFGQAFWEWFFRFAKIFLANRYILLIGLFKGWRPGFEYQAQHLCFYSQILYYICRCVEKKDEIKKKRPALGHDIF